VKELREAVEKCVANQNKITTDMVGMIATSEKVEKMAEDTKSLLSKGNLAAAFQTRAAR